MFYLKHSKACCETEIMVWKRVCKILEQFTLLSSQTTLLTEAYLTVTRISGFVLATLTFNKTRYYFR